jgi:hypothetical protein
MTATVDVAELPHVDEHAIVVERPAADAWDATLRTVERAFSSAAAARVARLLGCADVAAAGPRPLDRGSAFPGFHVADAAPGRELRLEGGHRFSRYALVLRIDELAPTRSRVRAETLAVFPGPHGFVYRTLVIGTRGHVLATRRILRAIERAAERR